MARGEIDGAEQNTRQHFVEKIISGENWGFVNGCLDSTNEIPVSCFPWGRGFPLLVFKNN
jgi:hypothetical protein